MDPLHITLKQQQQPKQQQSNQQQQQQQQQHQQQQLSKKPVLPFTTSLANTILRIRHPHQSHSLITSSIRYLSLILIRELALLEDLFIQSPIYRSIKFLTPSFLQPPSSTYPFLFTLTLALVQLKKSWKRQPNLLVNLCISLGPIINTLRALGALETEINPHSADQHHLQLRRWSIYWIVYCSFINLENFNIRVGSQAVPTLLRSRPTIYPSIPAKNPADDVTSRIHNLVKFFSSFRYLHTSLLNLTIPKSITAVSSSRPVQPPPRIPGELFDIHTPSLPSVRTVHLPEYLFGNNTPVYCCFKVIFLRWCSSDHSKILDQIWSSFLYPVSSLIGGAGLGSAGGKTARGGRTKVVTVTVSSDEDEQEAGGQAGKEAECGPPEAQAHFWGPMHGGLYQMTGATEGVTVEEDRRTGPLSRRIRSDPGRRSPSVGSSRPGPSSPSATRHSARSSSSHTGSSHPTSLPSPADPLKLPQPAALHHPNHPLLEFKTPENAWDSLSYIG